MSRSARLGCRSTAPRRMGPCLDLPIGALKQGWDWTVNILTRTYGPRAGTDTDPANYLHSRCLYIASRLACEKQDGGSQYLRVEGCIVDLGDP